MRVHTFRRLLATALVATLTACGGGDGNAGPNDPEDEDDEETGVSSVFTATINGQPYTATSTQVLGTPGTLTSVVGSAPAGTIQFAFIDTGPGTHTIGTAPVFNFLYRDFVNGGSWVATPTTGGPGTLTITMRTASRVRGTFQFTGVNSSDNGTGPRTITNGSFDIRF